MSFLLARALPSELLSVCNALDPHRAGLLPTSGPCFGARFLVLGPQTRPPAPEVDQETYNHFLDSSKSPGISLEVGGAPAGQGGVGIGCVQVAEFAPTRRLFSASAAPSSRTTTRAPKGRVVGHNRLARHA